MRPFSATTLGTQINRTSVGGFVITEAYNAPFVSLPSHAHELASITFLLSGSCEETLGSSRKTMSDCCAITKPPGAEHSNRYGRTGARVLIIEAEPEKLAAIRRQSRSFESVELIRGGNLATLAHRMYQESHLGDSASVLVLEGLVLEVIGQITRINESASGLPPIWLRKAKTICDERFNESLSLFRIAEDAGVHPAHLARTFRRHYRCTVGEYVRRARLNHAANELATSDRPLVEIATDAGFYDQSHFTHAFKLETGQTPSQYRSSTRGMRAGELSNNEEH